MTTFRSEQGSIWKRGSVDLVSNRPFEVVIEGFVGDDYRGDIALDDLSFNSYYEITYYEKLKSIRPSVRRQR